MLQDDVIPVSLQGPNPRRCGERSLSSRVTERNVARFSRPRNEEAILFVGHDRIARQNCVHIRGFQGLMFWSTYFALDPSMSCSIMLQETSESIGEQSPLHDFLDTPHKPDEEFVRVLYPREPMACLRYCDKFLRLADRACLHWSIGRQGSHGTPMSALPA